MTFTRSTITTLCLLLILHCLTVVVQADADEVNVKAFIMELAKDCQTGQISADDIKTMIHDDHPTHEAKCFVACILKKTGTMNEDGTFSPEGTTEFSKKMPVKDEAKKEEVTAAIIEKCGSMSGEDECETAFLIHQCAKGEYKAIHG